MVSENNGYVQRLEDLRTHFYQQEALKQFDCSMTALEVGVVSFLMGVVVGVGLDWML